MNPLRLFKGFRDLELRLVLAEAVQDKLRDRVRDLESVDIPALIADALAEHEKKTGNCAACSGVIDLTVSREHGPIVMEKMIDGKLHRVICCYDCEPYAKRNDWKRVRSEDLPSAPPRPTLVPAPEQGSAS